MKAVLQNTVTGCFLSEKKKWVPDIEDALSFASSFDAQEYCLKEGLVDVDIFIKLGPGRNVLLPYYLWGKGKGGGGPKPQ